MPPPLKSAGKALSRPIAATFAAVANNSLRHFFVLYEYSNHAPNQAGSLVLRTVVVSDEGGCTHTKCTGHADHSRKACTREAALTVTLHVQAIRN